MKQSAAAEINLDERKELAVNIWGDSILYKGSERSKIKFKEKFNLELY